MATRSLFRCTCLWWFRKMSRYQLPWKAPATGSSHCSNNQYSDSSPAGGARPTRLPSWREHRSVLLVAPCQRSKNHCLEILDAGVLDLGCVGPVQRRLRPQAETAQGMPRRRGRRTPPRLQGIGGVQTGQRGLKSAMTLGIARTQPPPHGLGLVWRRPLAALAALRGGTRHAVRGGIENVAPTRCLSTR